MGIPEWDKLRDAVTSAMDRTQSAYDSDESAFTWPRTQEGLDQGYPDKEDLIIDSEEAGERVIEMLRERIWLHEEEEEEESFPVIDKFGRPCSPSLYGTQGYTTGETIASLRQKLTPDTEEETTAEEDIDMAEASGETDGEGNEEEPNPNGKGPSAEEKGKGLDASQHAPNGERGEGVAGTTEGEKGGKGTKPKPKGRYKLIDGRNLATLVDDIIKWGAELAKNRDKGEKGARYREWAEFAHRQVIATGDLINKCVHMDVVAPDHMENGGWAMLQLWQQKDKAEGRDMEEFILNTIHAAEVYRRAKENVMRGENDEMKGVMRRLLEDMALVKGKLKIGTANEIAEVEKAEVKRVSEAEDWKRRSEDRAEADRRARTQREEEERRKKAESMAAEEELKQQERERQAAAALEQVEKEQERVISERPPEKATHIEHVTWAERITEAEKKRKQVEEDAKRVHHGVGVGGGWEVVEGKAMRMVEVTTYFTTPLTEEEKKSLPEKIRMVSDITKNVGLRRVRQDA